MNVKPNPGQGQDSPVGMVAASLKPCGKCGATDRNASGKCRPCQKLISAKWRKVNAERQRAQGAAWRDANKERHKAKNDAWYRLNRQRVLEASAARYAKNPAKKHAAVKAWRQKNPEAVRSYSNNRRFKKATGGRLSPNLTLKLYRLQRGKCACCGHPLGSRYEIDHIMPLALGGTNTDDNTQLLRHSCNRRKASKHPIDYMQSKGLLL